MWNTKKNDNEVKVVLPDGSEDRYDEVTVEDVDCKRKFDDDGNDSIDFGGDRGTPCPI